MGEGSIVIVQRLSQDMARRAGRILYQPASETEDGGSLLL